MTVTEFMFVCKQDNWYEVETTNGIYNVMLTDNFEKKHTYYYPLYNKGLYPFGIKTDEGFLEYIIDNTDGAAGINILDEYYTLIVDVLEKKE